MDAQADNKDKDDVMLLNQGEVTQVPQVDDCGYILIDLRGNSNYPTIRIGSQCWLAANLDIGDIIDNSLNQTDNNTIERYSGYLTGSLYQWDEMMQYDTIEGAQGICPDGWHIPSDAEWCMLEQSIDSTVDCSTSGWRGTDVGIKMQATGGFNAIMNGFRQPFAPFFANQDTLAFFWSSTQHGATTARYRQLDVAQAGIYRGTDLTKNYGLSVRCVKN